MAVPLNRRTRPADTAAKAAKIARDGGAITFTGALHRLGRVRDLLAGAEDLTVVLGAQDDGALLFVAPAGGAGRDRERV